MKVKDLVEKLNEFPPTATVMIGTDQNEWLSMIVSDYDGLVRLTPRGRLGEFRVEKTVRQ